MSSNLPPGVTDNMLPGNRPEDLQWDEVLEWAANELSESGLDPDEVQRAVVIGIAAVQAERKFVDLLVVGGIEEYIQLEKEASFRRERKT